MGLCDELIGIAFAKGDDNAADIDELPADEVQALLTDNRECSWRDFVEADVGRRQQIAAANVLLENAKVDELTAMIDNQPQLTLAVSLRERDPLMGQDETSVTVKSEMGTRNSHRPAADKSEFLGEHDEIFGAHPGLSHKLGKPGG